MSSGRITTLVERLCRPQRLGVFGHCGVGKTTLLATLYREAAAGRLANSRLAAADSRTAIYLADRIIQLEAGLVLPATLAETELRWHLYHSGQRLDLLAKDYQGEHIELDRTEPIREFLQDCDAVWLCLDAATLTSPATRLHRQQEVEQFLEELLAKDGANLHQRPFALVLTKADLVTRKEGRLPEAPWLGLEMSAHALATHCPDHARFAVSSLAALRGTGNPGLAEPLAWLATALQAQDAARLEELWQLARHRPDVLQRGTDCFARRYPRSPEASEWKQRLLDLRGGRRRRQRVLGAAVAACVAVATWSYDALGHHRASRFEESNHDDPAAVLDKWRAYQRWHPTRHVSHPTWATREREQLRELTTRVRQREGEVALSDLRRRAAETSADAAVMWQQFEELQRRYPDLTGLVGLEEFQADLRIRRDGLLRRQAEQAFDDLRRAEAQGIDLGAMLVKVDRFLHDFAGTAQEASVQQLRDACLRRVDERDIEAARGYSARQPFNFQTRREHYQRYLDVHPAGAFAKEAESALQAIDRDWDRHDFRAIRDHLLQKPGELSDLVARCRSYLAAHPNGQFGQAARDLLRWTERVSAPGEYRVVLRSGQFEERVAWLLSRGPDLSVELEVAGVRYGPSTIIPNRYDPQWDYEFPRRIKWKLGDPVRIRVTDHDYWKRLVFDLASAEGDPLAMRLLTGDAWYGGSHVTFESDFALPPLPAIE